jgi:hypothetical protein
MRITLHRNGRPTTYFVSAQTECDAREVERDIVALCDHRGQLHNVSVDFGGDDIPLVHRYEARIVSRMFAAEHNTYVFKNYGCGQTADDVTDRRVSSPENGTDDFDSDHEQNEDLGDPSFGPSHSQYTNW